MDGYRLLAVLFDPVLVGLPPDVTDMLAGLVLPTAPAKLLIVPLPLVPFVHTLEPPPMLLLPMLVMTCPGIFAIAPILVAGLAVVVFVLSAAAMKLLPLLFGLLMLFASSTAICAVPPVIVVCMNHNHNSHVPMSTPTNELFVSLV